MDLNSPEFPDVKNRMYTLERNHHFTLEESLKLTLLEAEVYILKDVLHNVLKDAAEKEKIHKRLRKLSKKLRVLR